MKPGVKILHIIDSLGLGGAQTLVKGIFESQQHNKNIFLIALRERETIVNINHSQARIIPSKKKYSLSPLRELHDFVKNEEIDILHCHLFRAQVFGWLLKVIWFKKIELVFHEHGEVLQGHFLYNFFLKVSKFQVDLYIAVSKVVRQALLEKGNIFLNRIVILHNFVDLNKFKYNEKNVDVQLERQRLNINDEDFVIGFAGRLSEIKGCDYLIKALPLLDFKYKLLIAGEGHLKEEYKHLSQKIGVERDIVFLGLLEDTVHFYNLLDILVVPSLSESFGLSVVEAQAMGVPVIASNVGGLQEIIQDGDNGLLCQAQDISSLGEKMNLLKKQTILRESIIKNGLETVRRYDLEKYLVSLRSLYQQV